MNELEDLRKFVTQEAEGGGMRSHKASKPPSIHPPQAHPHVFSLTKFFLTII